MMLTSDVNDFFWHFMFLKKPCSIFCMGNNDITAFFSWQCIMRIFSTVLILDEKSRPDRFADGFPVAET